METTDIDPTVSPQKLVELRQGDHFAGSTTGNFIFFQAQAPSNSPTTTGPILCFVCMKRPTFHPRR